MSIENKITEENIYTIYFPTWKDFNAANQKYIDNKEYFGHKIQYHLLYNLYLTIQCFNLGFSQVFGLKNSMDPKTRIEVSYGTLQGINIIHFETDCTEDNYYGAIKKALQWQNDLRKEITHFVNTARLGDSKSSFLINDILKF